MHSRIRCQTLLKPISRLGELQVPQIAQLSVRRCLCVAFVPRSVFFVVLTEWTLTNSRCDCFVHPPNLHVKVFDFPYSVASRQPSRCARATTIRVQHYRIVEILPTARLTNRFRRRTPPVVGATMQCEQMCFELNVRVVCGDAAQRAYCRSEHGLLVLSEYFMCSLNLLPDRLCHCSLALVVPKGQSHSLRVLWVRFKLQCATI